jgi:beta-lactamase regulating signal transducer with metallopeptidase domain
MFGPHVISLLMGCGVRASLPAGFAWAATRLASRSSAAARHSMWASAIAIALLLPVATLATPHWNIGAPTPLARLVSTARTQTAAAAIRNVATTGRIEPEATSRPNDLRQDALTLWTIASWIWTTGAVLVFCYVLIGHFAAWRLYRTTRTIRNSWVQEAQQLAKKLGLNRTVRIVESEQISVPIVLHFWQSIIVMPAAATQWPWSRVRAVLLHELAHIKRNDLHMQSLAQLACSVYWFNPLVWFAAHQLRVERERACDDCVLLDGTSSADYAAHLFQIARAGSRSSATSFAIGLTVPGSRLEQRLVAIMNPGTPRHSTTILYRLMVAIPMLLVAVAAGAVQITARAIKVPVAAIGIPAPAIQVRAGAAEPFTGGGQAKTHSVSTESSAEHPPSAEFHWAATMREGQTVDVHLGRGSIRVLPSADDTVRVQARTDNPRQSEIQTVSTATGVKFCSVVTRAHESLNYCEQGQSTSPIQKDQTSTEFVIYVPAGLRFVGSTVLGDITAERPATDSDMATIDGNITFELAAKESANFDGNVIEGAIDSDFPLTDNTLALPNGERPVNAPRIVHATVGPGGPHLTATVVSGNIRLRGRSTE